MLSDTEPQQGNPEMVASVREAAPATHFGLAPLSPVGGAEITGIDLSEPLAPGTVGAIRDAFLAHHILVFRDQNLSGEAQLAFTRNFGEIEGHVGRLPNGERLPLLHVVSNLGADGGPTRTPPTHGNYFWHTDKSYHAVPSLLTMLHAVEVPPEGGDTQFANMHMAYAALDDATREEVSDLRAIHSWEANRRNTGNTPATEMQKRERPPVSHPITRIHPETGRKSLYIGVHTSHVEGRPRDEGRAFLDRLLRRATREEFIYTHKWRRGDLVLWDNRCLLHRAVANYDMESHRRILHRTVVRGTVPY